TTTRLPYPPPISRSAARATAAPARSMRTSTGSGAAASTAFISSAVRTGIISLARSSPSLAPRSLAACLPADGGPYFASHRRPGGHPALRLARLSQRDDHGLSDRGGVGQRHLPASHTPGRGQCLRRARDAQLGGPALEPHHFDVVEAEGAQPDTQ